MVNIKNKHRRNIAQQQTEQVIFKNINCIYIYKNSYNSNQLKKRPVSFKENKERCIGVLGRNKEGRNEFDIF